MKMYAAIAFAMAAALPSASFGQDVIDLPLVQDVPVLAGIETGSGDILGIKFGDSYDTAMAVLKAAYPAADITENIYAGTVSDNSGNSITFRYRAEVVAAVVGPPVEEIRVGFTTEVTGGRVYRIRRTVVYPQDALGSMSDLRAAIEAKYGTPLAVELYPHQGSDQITYTWETVPREPFGTQNVAERPFNAVRPDAVDPCATSPIASAYGTPQGDNGYSFFGGARQANPNWETCIGGIRFTIFYGNNDKTVSRIEIVGTDYARSLLDGQLADRMIAALVQAKRDAVSGVGAPKL